MFAIYSAHYAGAAGPLVARGYHELIQLSTSLKKLWGAAFPPRFDNWRKIPTPSLPGEVDRTACLASWSSNPDGGQPQRVVLSRSAQPDAPRPGSPGWARLFPWPGAGQQHRQLAGPGRGGVKEVPVRHGVVLAKLRGRHCGKLAAPGAVRRDGVARQHRVQPREILLRFPRPGITRPVARFPRPAPEYGAGGVISNTRGRKCVQYGTTRAETGTRGPR